jgi:DNA repair protein RecO (recombination protein O)
VTLYRDSGVVLRTYKLRESDRIVVLMTEQHGKVRAVARGVRKGSSKFGGRLEPLSHIALLLNEGRELDSVSQVESIDHFRTLREDLDRMSSGISMLEAVDQIAQEREPNPKLYQMLVGALRTLAARPAPLLVPAFYWKVLAAAGVHPQLEVCVSCDEPEGLVSFDLFEGGVLCRACRRGVPISPDALNLMRRILGGDMLSALSEPYSPAVHEVEILATKAFEHHVERRLRVVHTLGGT